MVLYDTGNSKKAQEIFHGFELNLNEISYKVHEWIGGVTIGKIFVLIYFMFLVIWISLRGLYL